jgi:hypothetical protein
MTHKVPRINTQNWEKVIESGMADYEMFEKPSARRAVADEESGAKRVAKRRRETSHRSRSM